MSRRLLSTSGWVAFASTSDCNSISGRGKEGRQEREGGEEREAGEGRGRGKGGREEGGVLML